MASQTNSVVFWPVDAVRKVASDYQVDSTKQLDALRQANPTQDAVRAFLLGDRRFIADRFALPRIQGVPDDEVVRPAYRRRAMKVIALSEDLATNEEFTTLKQVYEDRFNKTMYGLVKTQ